MKFTSFLFATQWIRPLKSMYLRMTMLSVWRSALALGLLMLLVACRGAEGQPTLAPPTAIPNAPTPLVLREAEPVTTAPSAAVVSPLEPLQALLRDSEYSEGDREQLIDTLRQTIAAYLTAAPEPLAQASVADLTGRLQMMLPDQREPLALLADLDQDRQPDVVLGVSQTPGLPAFAFLSSQRYTGRALPPGSDLPVDELSDDFILSAWFTALQAIDLTGDAQPELMLSYTLPGASGFTERLYLFHYRPELQALGLIFQADLITWAGESSWELASGPDDSQAILLKGPGFGPFDHKLMAHPTRSQRWEWDALPQRFVKVEESLSEARSPRQQFNVAEMLLRQGAYEAALVEFQKVPTTPVSPDIATMEGSPTDWTGLSFLRLGQTQALLGQNEAALASLVQARASGSTIGDLASAFLSGYQSGDPVSAWVAMMQETNLARLLHEGTPGNLGFPVDAFGLYYPPLAVAAYLERQPQATTGTAGQLLAALTDAGLAVKAAMVEDLTGDGLLEIVFIWPDSDQDFDRVWLAYRNGSEPNRWRTTLLTEGSDLALEGATPLPGGGQAVRINYPESYQPLRLGYGWDNGRVIVYDLAGPVPEARPSSIWPRIGGF